ncbi:MAG: glycosyltransferase family 2 protein [Patescibacteria group bacterium]
MKNYTKVSVVIPAYNEMRTIRSVIDRTEKADVLGLEKEIIVVDNCSTDGTREVIDELGKSGRVRAILHEKNLGVGTSWRDGIAVATGQIIVRQDADMEYMPEDFPLLLRPILDGKTEIVYGSRILGFEKSKYRYKTYLWGGILINKLCTLIIGTRLSDILTASKVFDKSIFEKFSLMSVHFEIEAELTAKACRAGFRIIEVPITYNARSFEEGKKIRWHHAFVILRSAVYHRFFSTLK